MMNGIKNIKWAFKKQFKNRQNYVRVTGGLGMVTGHWLGRSVRNLRVAGHCLFLRLLVLRDCILCASTHRHTHYTSILKMF